MPLRKLSWEERKRRSAGKPVNRAAVAIWATAIVLAAVLLFFIASIYD